MSDNQHNDPLEEFFRKKAGEYDIQYKEDDWLKLSTRLDKLDQQRTNLRRRRLAAAAVILLLSVLAYITYNQQMKINQLNERLTQAENVSNLPNFGPDILSNQLLEYAEKNQTQQEDPQGSKPEVATESVNTTDEQSNSPSNIEKREMEEFLASQATHETFPKAELKENNLALTTAKASPGVDGRSPAISAITPPKFNSAAVALSNDPRANTSTATASHLTNPYSRFSLAVLLGPDMTTVGSLSNFSDPGHKIGMTIEYNLSQNLAISVGALHSRVKYTASGSEYQPPQGYWSYGIAPDHTMGECILIDIPISIKYDFFHFHRSRLYATAGASSYIMLDEDYRFSYDNNYSGLQQRWHEKTGTRHWMSNATLSVGYELDLSQTLSIRAEPFLRVPIQEVGWGNVKLYSIGSFISLNYNFH